MANKQTIEHLHELQALPLNLKVRMTKQRIREWVDYYGTDGVYVSFSGGKDSTVLLHIVREMYGDKIPGVFVDTGLEYPEIRDYVRTYDNIVWVKPKKNFFQVCEEYGFPLISKEVSECVYGARRYLTKVIEENADLNERTNERTNAPYAYFYEKLTGAGKYKKEWWKQIQSAVENCEIGKRNGPARDFAAVTGIRNREGKADPTLWQGYRPQKTPTASGNISDGRESNDGDYP